MIEIETKKELAVTVLFLLLGLAIILGAGSITELEVLRDPIGARAFAYVIGLFVVGCSILLLARQLAAIRRSELTDAPRGDDPRYPASVKRAIAIMALIPVYAWSMAYAGYIIATVCFVTTCLWLMEVRTRGRLFVYPLVFTLATFVLFGTLMDVRLPLGPMASIIEWARLS